MSNSVNPPSPAVSVAVFWLLDPPELPVELTLHVGEWARRGLMGHCRAVRGRDNVPPQLCGRLADGPARGHRHLSFLAVDLDADGNLDAVIVCGGTPLDPGLRQLIRSMSWLKLGGRRVEVRSAAPFPVRGRLWRSRTPLILTRHPKRKRGRWVDSPRAQLVRELDGRGLPQPTLEVSEASWPGFVTRRATGGGRRSLSTTFSATIRFDQPVSGPFSLGFGSHFGLGLFWPTDNATPTEREP